jgi:TolA-binding protein
VAEPPVNQLDTPERTDVSPNAIPPTPAEPSSPAARRDTPSTPRLERQAHAPTANTPPNRSTTTYERPAAGSNEAQLSETQLLAQARSAEPARALALAEEHARRFPASALAQEREFVIITALLRSGNRSAAEQRARQFARSYPKSPYLARLQSLLPNALEAE